MKQKKLWISLILFVLLTFLIQVIGGFWTRESITTWYPTLVKPSWNPPSFVFGPVWTVLYIMIAISGWLIYQAYDSHKRNVTLILYGIQLSLNFIWSFLFFSLRSPVLAMIDIILLCFALGLTIIKAWSVRPLAALLLIPYLMWVMYATTLNIAIWWLNK